MTTPPLPDQSSAAFWRDLVLELADPDWHGHCRFDHHGYCQAHGYMETNPPCPYQRARAALEGAPGERCDRPPEGWMCDREPGHFGPCSAHYVAPDEEHQGG